MAIYSPNWEQACEELLISIGCFDLGKQRWCKESNGLWYDRKEHDYITLDEVIGRAMEVLQY